MAEQRTLLVTGASGHVGRRVVELLLDRKLPNTTLIATTRNPEKLSDFAARGVVVRKADFTQPATLAEAFKGAQRLLLISVDSLEQGKRFEQQKAAIDAASAAGVQHIIYTSIIRAYANHPVLFARDHKLTEEYLAASKLDYTIIRQSLWFDTLLRVVPAAATYGKLVTAAGDGRVSFHSREETSIISAAELASDRTGRSITNSTGATGYTYAEVAAEAAKVLGKPIEVVKVSKEAKVKVLSDAGLPPPLAEVFVTFDVASAEGWFSDSAPPHIALHRPRETLAEWLTRHREALLKPQ